MNNILIVDDSATMRRMVQASLRTLSGVSFDEAGTGLEAIERLSARPASLMILDLNMPDMHGLEVLRFLRRNEMFRRLPVIVLTTRSDEVSRSAALEAGATLFMTKPFTPQVLAASTLELLTANQRPA
jgi:two-component system chemotaxis response regulator CheY